jgi:glycosyltransferase involved in cell wall biosynthesis
MDLPSVSIVCTNFNQGRFAGNCFSSIQQQTYPHDKLEVIIVDDGSEDDSLEIIKHAVYDNLTIPHKLLSKSNGGTGSAREAGVKISNGEIINFLDIDDKLREDCIEKRVLVFNKYPDVLAVYSDFWSWHSDGKLTYDYRPHMDVLDLLQECIVSTNSSFRKEIFDIIGYFDKELKIIEDFDFYLRVARQYQFFHIAEPLFYYRIHNNQKTRTHNIELIQKEHQYVFSKAKKLFGI